MLMIGLTVAACAPLHAAAADLYQDEAETDQGFDQGRFGGVRQNLHDWKVFVGVGAIYSLEYEGSDKMKVRALPAISATFGDRVHVDTSGVSVDVLETGGFNLALRGGYEIGRQEDDSDHLRGLGDIDPGGIVGARASYSFGPMEVYGLVDKTIGGSDGLIGKAGVNVSQRYDRFILGAGVSATFADDNHMQSYFGVNAAQSARSGLREYDAKAGLKRYDIDASVTYLVTDNWMVRAHGGVGFLQGDAKDSPVVQNDVQPFAALTVGYKF